ncbi:hypothetical protein P9G84_19085 [Brevibacillus centrosporus]|uniref:hypothetical protein n=1 Tax=Brevibacillus centrosporus TaxID=54910 RepID=UPI001171C234|nr:hypothetical protein [Brevibacillus centrosporus]MEC2131031.1 hypothetical protein [Brevibacillus centrosporus]GED32358.1 hypothetical protein BCE02nite_34990 [Brevibacillus centrosporus]
MGFLKDLFVKKDSSCCNVKIEEVKETKESCCNTEEAVSKEVEKGNDSCCK